MAASFSVFLSYRRDDTRHLSARIYEQLAREFGEGRVFFDVDTLPRFAGWDFEAVIRETVPQCSVFLAIIGREWGPLMRKRLHDPKDFVQIELAIALKTPGIRVIPVLVDGAMMPHADDLPEALRDLPAKQNVVLPPDPHLRQAVNNLARELLAASGAARAQSDARAPGAGGPSADPEVAATPSASAWAQIAQSLDKSHYRRFERAFETDPLAFNSVMEAEARVKALERWEGVDKADPAAIAQFLRAPGFAALEAHARAAMHQAVEARQRAEKEAVEEARQQEAQEQVRSVFQNRWSQLISSPFRRYWLSMLGHFSAATATSSVLLFIVGVLIRLLDGDSLYELVDAVAEGYIAALVYTAPPNLLLAAVFARNNSASSLSALIVIGVLIFGIITLAGCNAILGVLFTGGMLSWFGVKIFAVLRRKNVHRE